MQNISSQSDSRVWLTVVVCVSLWLVWSFVKRRLQWWTTFNKLPGPTLIQLTRCHWKLYRAKDLTESLKVFYEMVTPFAHNSPLCRIWLGPFPWVFVSKAEAVKTLLTSQTQIEKAYVYKYLRNWLSDGLLTSKGSKWQQRRKLLTPAFHFKILEDFRLVMNDQAAILVQLLHQRCEETKGGEFDIYPFINRCALDILCETAMGHGVNAQFDHQSEYVRAINSLEEIVASRVLNPLLPDWIYRMTSMGREEQRSINISRAFNYKKSAPSVRVHCCVAWKLCMDVLTAHCYRGSQFLVQKIKYSLNNGGFPLHAKPPCKNLKISQVIEMKRQKLSEWKQDGNTRADGSDNVLGMKRRMALLDLLLEQTMDINHGQPLTDHDIREEVDTFMQTGHTSTSTAITCVLYYVGLYQHVQQKIVDEITEAYNGESTSIDLQKLKYLECVIKETLRLCPSTPVIGRHLTEDINICGYTIPAGVTVAIPLYLTHRDPAYFPQPHVFDPDRFLPENSQDRDPYVYIPFSAGLRNCIGQRYAMMEVKVVVAAVLKRFRLTVVEPHVMTELIDNGMSKTMHGLPIRMELRST